MNRNSPANKAPAISPALSKPSLSNSGMLRRRAQRMSSTVASIERRPPCITGEISAAASLVATLVKPQMKQHNTMVAKATESSGTRFTCLRGEGRGARDEGQGMRGEGNLTTAKRPFYALSIQSFWLKASTRVFLAFPSPLTPRSYCARAGSTPEKARRHPYPASARGLLHGKPPARDRADQGVRRLSRHDRAGRADRDDRRAGHRGACGKGTRATDFQRPVGPASARPA